MKRPHFFLLIALCFPIFFSQTTRAQTNAWRPVEIQGLGFVTGIVFHPVTGELYNRTDVGGLFRWDEEQDRWINLTDRYARQKSGFPQQVESIALDPQTPWTIYAVMGDNLADHIEDETVIIKSVDNGETWTTLATFDEEVLGSGGNQAWRHAGERLKVDPNNSNMIYFGSRTDGLWRSLDAGESWAPLTAFPTAGGNGGEPEPGGLSFVVFDDTSESNGVSQNIYVGVFDAGLYRSNDGGDSWCQLSGGPDLNPIDAEWSHGRLHLAYSGDGLYEPGGIYLFEPGSGCADGSWLNKTPPAGVNDCPTYGAYAWGAVAVHPFDEDIALIAPFGVSPRKLFVTFNLTDPTPIWHITTDEASADAIGPYIACPDQAMFHTFETPEWFADTAYQYDFVGGVAIHPFLPDEVWVATGHGTLRVADFWADGSVFDYDSGMNGMEELCVVDLLAPPAPNLTPLYSAHWDTFGFRHDDLNRPPSEKFQSGTFLRGRTLALSAQNPNNLIALASQEGDSLNLISSDGGNSWEALNPFVDTATGQPGRGGNIAISATDPNNIVWTPANDPGLGQYAAPHVTFNGGSSWSRIDALSFTQGSFPLHNQAWNGQVLVADPLDGGRFTIMCRGLVTQVGTQFFTEAPTVVQLGPLLTTRRSPVGTSPLS